MNISNHTIEYDPLVSFEELNSIELAVFDHKNNLPELEEKLGISPLMRLFSSSVDFTEYYPRSIELLTNYLIAKRVELTLQEIEVYLKYLIVWHKYTAGGITRYDIHEHPLLIPSEYYGSIEETFFRIIATENTPGLDDIEIDQILRLDFNEFISLIATRLHQKFSSMVIEP